MKKLILFILVISAIKCVAQDGAVKMNQLQISATNPYNRLAYFDPNGILHPFPNGILGQMVTMGTSTPIWTSPSVYSLPIASLTVLGGVKIGTGISIDGSGAVSPTWGTTHTTSAYGDHLHTGVYQPAGSYDNYGYWTYGANGTTYGDVSSHNIFYTSSGTGIRNTEYTSASGGGVTVNLDLGALTTISNHTASYYFPVAASNGSGATQAKVTISSIEGLIGTTTSDVSRLVKRDASGIAYAADFVGTSDKRLKQNIKPLKKLDWVDNIKFVQFESKDDKTHRERFGVLAQDVEEVNSDLVYTNEDGFKGVAYTDLIIAKLAAMEKKISELTQKVEDLEFINEGQKELLNMKKLKRHAK